MSNFSRFLFPSPKYNSILVGAYCSVTGIAGYVAWNRRHNLSNQKTSLNSLSIVHKSFLHSQPLNSSAVAEGVCARIKCMKPNQLTHLSASHKPYSWVFSNCGLYNLSKCKTDYDKLMHLGFEKDWIELQLINGNDFNLYLFPEKSKNYTATWATWNGIYSLLEENEAEIYERILPFKQELQSTAFEDIESKSDFEFLDIEDIGPRDHRYLTKERFLAIEKEYITLVDVRFLLYCYLGLSKYFDGDGYTMDKNGEIGCKEYLIKNMRLNDMEQLKVIKLNVKIPNQ